MLIDEIIKEGESAARKDFLNKVGKDCEHIDFNREMDKAGDTFTYVAAMCAEGRGFIAEDAWNYAFSAWDRCRAGFIEDCRKNLLDAQKEHAVKEVRAVEVGCTIEPRIAEAGFPYRIEYQKYRLKICIRLDWKYHLEFYIRYRDFGKEKIIDGIPEMIRDCVKYIQIYGPQMSLRANIGDDNWTYPDNYTDKP